MHDIPSDVRYGWTNLGCITIDRFIALASRATNDRTDRPACETPDNAADTRQRGRETITHCGLCGLWRRWRRRPLMLQVPQAGFSPARHSAHSLPVLP